MALYKNAPVQEIVCEFQFEQGDAWDIAQPGLIYEKLRDRFPKRRQVQNVKFSFGAANEPPAMKTIPRVRFLQEDEKLLVQVGQNFLAVNRLPPYDDWEGLQSVIERAFTAYVEVSKPKAISRVGLRYINRIPILADRVEMNDYFNVYPETPKNLGDHLAFDMSIMVSGAVEADAMKIQLSPLPSDTLHGLAFLLDLDYFTRDGASLSLDQVKPWLERAHERVHSSFEHCLTKKLRDLFL